MLKTVSSGEDKTFFVKNNLDRYMDHALEFWEDKGLIVDYHQILPTEDGISLTIVFKKWGYAK